MFLSLLFLFANKERSCSLISTSHLFLNSTSDLLVSSSKVCHLIFDQLFSTLNIRSASELTQDLLWWTSGCLLISNLLVVVDLAFFISLFD
ncbi:hypothetical protein QYF36_012815 [Acer negundo]|nr:hypothetical protein QYF36_012815 [Acer negundo]